MSQSNEKMNRVNEAAAIRATDRRQNDFLARLVHELRNPLAPIQMALQIMDLSEDDVATVRAARMIIDRQLRLLTRLIDDLGDITQLGSSSLVLRREWTPLAALTRAGLEIARPQLEARQNALHIEPGDPQHTVYADTARVAQAIANLLINASKFSALAAPIHLAANTTENDVVITVSDVGAGIPTDMLARIFEPFVQVDPSGLGTHDGLGIGLTLVKNVAEAHGGSVWAESSASSAGSRFHIRLARDPGPHLVRDLPIGPAHEANRPLRILVADDNRDAAQTLAIMLRMDGHEVQTAHDGREALAIGEFFQPELVLLDIGMPVLDGYQTASHMREREWGRSAYLVALTGWGQEVDRQSALGKGFHEHIVKPAAPDRLESVIRSAQRLAEAKPGS